MADSVMRRVRGSRWPLLFPALLAAACAATPAGRADAERAARGFGKGLLLRFDAPQADEELARALERIDGTLLRDYELLPGLVHVHTERSADEVRDLLDHLELDVRPNRLLHLTGRPSGVSPGDPLFAKQWGLLHGGDGAVPRGLDVRAPEGWRVRTDSDVIVAVLDTGVSVQHEDLVGNIWHNEDERTGRPGVDDDGNGHVDDHHGWNFVHRHGQGGSGVVGSPEVADIDGHGTAVASILAARGDNGLGMTGLLWRARIMPLRIFKRTSKGVVSDVATAVDALDYAVQHGARVSCNSWGAAVPADEVHEFRDLYDAIHRAQHHGHLFVASAGNGVGGKAQDIDVNPFLPAAFDLPNIVAVTGVDPDGHLPPDFNYGALHVDLAAPAIDVIGADFSDLHDYVVRAGGTSFATPLVAAAAALFWAEAGPEKVSYGRVKQALRETARALPALHGKTASGGLLDVGALLAPLAPPGTRPVRPIEASDGGDDR